MGPTNKQKLMLYSLGQCYNRFNKSFKEKPLAVFVSKAAFIDMLMNNGMIDKKERALYKDLEFFEKKKLISYDNKNIKFTQKGYNLFSKISKEINPFFEQRIFWNSNAVKINRKLQSTIRSD